MSDAPCDWSWATYLELSATHSLYLPLLGLGVCVCRKTQAVHKGRLLPAPSLWSAKVSEVPEIHLACRLSLRLKEWKSSSSTPLHQVLSTTEWCKSDYCRWGYCFTSGWCYLEGSALPEKDGLCSMGNDSAQGSWQLFLQFSPQSHQLQTLLTCL